VVATNTIDISVTSHERRPPAIGEVDLAADPPSGQRRTPLNLNVVQISATRFRVSRATFVVPGTWQFDLTVRVGLTELLARVPIKIAAAPSH
jgi:hypothetical protein